MQDEGSSVPGLHPGNWRLVHNILIVLYKSVWSMNVG